MESSFSTDSGPSKSPLPFSQLSSIKAQLDLVLLALEALVGIGSEAMLTTASQLGLKELVGDRVALWRLRQASPLRKGQGRKKLDVDEARALTLISVRLARTHEAKIRRAVQLLEEALEAGRPPHRVALLGDYLDTFNNTYQERMETEASTSPAELNDLALKLLVDLLFYSAAGGERRLWLVLLERSI